jgi:uncharacterized protein with PIN domain
MLAAMDADPQLTETIMPLILGGALFFFAWRKKRGQFGVARAAVNVYLNERRMRCLMCEGEVFQKREGLLNTTWVSLFKLDPLNESAHCLTCQTCGYVHWFAQRHGATANTYLRYEDDIRGVKSLP